MAKLLIQVGEPDCQDDQSNVIPLNSDIMDDRGVNQSVTVNRRSIMAL